MNRYRIFQAVSAVILVAGLVAAVLLSRTLIKHQRGEIRHATEIEVQHITAQFRSGALNSVEPLRELGAWWLTQGKPLDLEDWRTDGQLFLSRSPGLRQAVWVDPDGLQRWSAAPGAAPVPTDRPPNADVLDMVALARARRAEVMSGIIDLPGDGAGVSICVPIVRSRRIFGFLIGTYDARELVASLAESYIRPESRVSISSGGRIIYSSPSGYVRQPEESAGADLEILNRVWTVALRVPLSAYREFKALFFSVASVIGALLYSFAMLLLIAHRRSAELQRANQALETEISRRMSSEAEVLALNRDLTRKVAEFQTLMDVIPIPIAVAEDPKCEVVRPNRAMAEFLGVQQGVNISRSFPDSPIASYRILRNGEEVQPEEMPMRRAAEAKRDILGEEFQLKRSGGEMVDVLSFASPVFDENGRVRGLLNAYVDITERKSQERMRSELEQRLQRAARMQSLGVMAAGIAHDFNNLLTGVIGEASLASDTLPPDADAQRHIASSIEAAQRAAELVRKMVAYTGQLYYDLRPTDLGEVVRGSEATLLSLAGTKAKIQFRMADPLPQVLADPEEIRHALYNLVLNAVEAAEPGRNCIEIGVDVVELRGDEVELTARKKCLAAGPYLRVQVTDNGPGMPPEIAAGAFDPFFTTKFLGRGLGLPEVLGIALSHRGGVKMETALGGGTSVKLFIPACPSEA